MKIEDVIKEKGGIKLDVGCGEHKQGPDWVGLDVQELPGVDIVHDFNVHPWPLPDECVLTAIASHVLEHVPKMVIDGGVTRWPFIEFMDEVWRIMKHDGSFAIVVPHGASPGFMQDPTHVSQINETTFAYFDPIAFGGQLYGFYRPKPWKIKLFPDGEPNMYYDPSGNLEIVLVKRRMDASYG